MFQLDLVINTLDQILSKTEIPKIFDVLLIDVDSIDYQIWESLHEYKPLLAVIEFNETYGTSLERVHNIEFKKRRDMVVEKLNAIVWPEIRLLAEAEISRIKAEDNDVVIVLEAAVLIEADWQDLCDEVWVVSVPVDITRARLMDRNNLDEDSAQSRIESQMSMEEREEFADVVIRNDSSVAQFNNRVEEAWISLLERVGA